LNYCASGLGNATLDLSHIPEKTLSQELILQELSRMSFSSPFENWDSFREKLFIMGAIAEEFLEGEGPQSPSVQGVISLNGEVEVVSTHEQVLQGQLYKGCIFPASAAYRAKIHHYGMLVGSILAKKGVRGHYGVDFLVQAALQQEKGTSSVNADQGEEERRNGCDSVGNKIYAIEINLRQCGTTHPFFAMKLLTGGSYDMNSGLYYDSKGSLKYYSHSDNLHKDQYKGILPIDLLEKCTKENLVFDHHTKCGPVFHILGALSQCGKVGVTCIGNSQEEAASLQTKVEAILEELGKHAQTRPKTVKISATLPPLSPME